jgi:hypothetical protein
MSKLYPVGIVGESHCQAAIGRCSEGETVSIFHEIGNPYDELALVVHTRAGEKLGYISRENFVRDVIHEQGMGITATIKSIAMTDAGLFGVVLDVGLCDDPVYVRDYEPSERPRS